MHVNQRVEGGSVLVCNSLFNFRNGLVLQNYQAGKFSFVQKCLVKCALSLRSLTLRQDLEDKYSKDVIHKS